MAAVFIAGIAVGIAVHRGLMALILEKSPDTPCACCEWLWLQHPTMKITIDGDTKEIAALVLEIQERQKLKTDAKAVPRATCGTGQEAPAKQRDLPHPPAFRKN